MPRPAIAHQPAAVVRDAALVVLAAIALALLGNRLRPTRGLPLFASRPYEVLVPCPEHRGRASAIEGRDLSLGPPGTLLVDGRSPKEHGRWHAPGAISLPFDYLEPVPAEAVQRLLRARPRRVVVYGDGEQPDSGEQLAHQLAGRGLREVFYLRGGAPALRELVGQRTRAPRGGR